MENNDEIKELVNSFKEYRDLLTPIEKNLKDFADTYQNLSGDIQKLNSSFGGNIQGKLDGIYNELSKQFEKSKDLSSQIENFVQKTNSFADSLQKLQNTFEKIQNKLASIDEVEKKAEEQIEKLNLICEEKKKNYDIKELEKNLEIYNKNVQQINNYINNDIANALKNSNEKISQIKDKNESVLETLLDENSNIEKLVESYQESNKILKNFVEKDDINQDYLFSVLDKWANDRGVKTKK